MDNEIESIENNNTRTPTELPKDVKTIGVKWVFNTKTNEAGIIKKCKAFLVVMGYSEKHGIQYSKVFSPIAWLNIVRMVIVSVV